MFHFYQTDERHLRLNRLLYQRPDTWMWHTRGSVCERRTSKLLTPREGERDWIRDKVFILTTTSWILKSTRLQILWPTIPWHWNPCLPKPLNWRWREKKRMKCLKGSDFIYFRSKTRNLFFFFGFAAHFTRDILCSMERYFHQDPTFQLNDPLIKHF